MGTRADFYIKTEKEELVWLASIAWDGYPDGVDDENDYALLKSETQTAYIENLQRYLGIRKDVTLPERGWPWPWDDSTTTDYAYCFHNGMVYANNFGNGWFNAVKSLDEENERDIIWEHPFPDMKDIKNIRYDEGSGVIIIKLPS